MATAAAPAGHAVIGCAMAAFCAAWGTALPTRGVAGGFDVAGDVIIIVGPLGGAVFAGAGRADEANILAMCAGLFTIVGPSSANSLEANGFFATSVAARITTFSGFAAASAAIVRGFAKGMTFCGGGCVPRGVRDGALVTTGDSDRRP